MLGLEPIFFISAFFAGVLMFLAPCTLPLLPAYLGFISGVTEKELEDFETKKIATRHILKNSLMFVSGFSFVFILSGMVAGLLGSFVIPLFGTVIKIMGGLLIIVFGLFMMGLLKTSFLMSEKRISTPKWLTIGTPISSLFLGAAFAVGWTPCIGPVYGTILYYASSTETVFAGALLLTVFAIGFSLPLLGLALAISQATRLVEKITPYLHTVSVFGGFVLVILGITLVFGDTGFTNWFFHIFEYIDFGDVIMSHT